MGRSTESETPLIIIQETSDALNTQLINHYLHHLETFLTLFGFCQNSFFSFTFSWVSFLLFGIALPLLIIQVSYCSNCEKYQIKSFELQILVSQSLVAAISLICISHNFRKYGLRKFLFVDRYHGHVTQFRDEYIRKIKGFFHLLVVWVLPCFLLKAAREVSRIRYIDKDSWWQSAAIILGLLFSWTYLNIIFLSGSALFNLVCNLQIIHLENYGKLLERDLDVSEYITEHIRLNHNLSKISHRFRIFLLLEFLVVTASEFMALLQTTGNRGIINLINGGDFAVSCIVELVGIIICLHGAAKISHRAQALVSITSKWHALVTCNSSDNPSQVDISVTNGTNNEADITGGSIPVTYSENDLESVDFVPVPTNAQLASSLSLYHKRQAFVTYMESNLGGASVFGWRIDRTLVNTIFFIELSLVLFVLGKTITFTTK
ncbi:hypothetical protein CsatB_018226 [Cannabis sativa]